MAGERTWRCERGWVAKESSLYSAVYKNCGMQVSAAYSIAVYKWCGIQVLLYTSSDVYS